MSYGVSRHAISGVLLAADNDSQLVGAVFYQPHHLGESRVREDQVKVTKSTFLNRKHSNLQTTKVSFVIYSSMGQQLSVSMG